MTRKERLLATLRGETVDRPAVCFYEIDGYRQDENDASPFNIYRDPSWLPLLELARECADRIVMCGMKFKDEAANPQAELTTYQTWDDENGSRFVRTEIRTGDHVLTQLTRRDPDVDTLWTLEHFLKNTDDFRAWLDLPQADFRGTVDTTQIQDIEASIGEGGIAMLSLGDPLCAIAPLFEMGDYTVTAFTENALMHQALEKNSAILLPKIEAVAQALPGRLWRIVGPEYASPPYLPPRLFTEYVTRYVTPMVEIIQRYGGYARVHCHGNIRDILDDIAATGCAAIDPIEPPPQGNVALAEVRERHGEQLVLFGNLEISDIENLSTAAFMPKVETALREGMAGEGRGFVLMPSACPYGRKLAPQTLRNYVAMVERVEAMAS